MRLWLWRLNCSFVTMAFMFVTVAFIFCIRDYGIYNLSLWLWRIDMKMMSGGIFTKICCSIKYWNISQFLHVYREAQGNIKLSILSIKVPPDKPGEIYTGGNFTFTNIIHAHFFLQALDSRFKIQLVQGSRFKVQDSRFKMAEKNKSLPRIPNCPHDCHIESCLPL